MTDNMNGSGLVFIRPEAFEVPNEAERNLCTTGGVDPKDYVSLTVGAQLVPSQLQFVKAPAPGGGAVEAVVSLWTVPVPAEAFEHISRIIQADGSMPNPMVGAANLAQIRILLPRSAVKSTLIEHVPAASTDD